MLEDRCQILKRTQKIFEEQGLIKLWKQPLELLDDELFETKVINPDTKTYNQVSDLPVGYRKLGEIGSIQFAKCSRFIE